MFGRKRRERAEVPPPAITVEVFSPNRDHTPWWQLQSAMQDILDGLDHRSGDTWRMHHFPPSGEHPGFTRIDIDDPKPLVAAHQLQNESGYGDQALAPRHPRPGTG